MKFECAQHMAGNAGYRFIGYSDNPEFGAAEWLSFECAFEIRCMIIEMTGINFFHRLVAEQFRLLHGQGIAAV